MALPSPHMNRRGTRSCAARNGRTASWRFAQRTRFEEFHRLLYCRFRSSGDQQLYSNGPRPSSDLRGYVQREISLNLFSNDFQGTKPTARSRPAVFQGTQDWVEGTNSTLGATKNFAIYDPANPANNRPWKDNAGNDVPRDPGTGEPSSIVPKIENAVFEEWGGEPLLFGNGCSTIMLSLRL